MRFIMIETKEGNVAINPQNITSIRPYNIGGKTSKYVYITLGEVTLDTKFTDVESAVDYIQRAPSVSMGAYRQ